MRDSGRDPGGGHTSRLVRLRAAMADRDLPALLLSDRASIRWLTGFAGSAGSAYVQADPTGAALLVTDGRYVERAADEAPGWAVVDDRTHGWLADHHDPDVPLGVEADVLTLATARSLESDGWRLAPTEGVVGTLRQRKDAAEEALLRRACAITAEAFDRALGWLAPGLTERQIARRLLEDMVDLGADGQAFAPIVAAGPNGSRPHHDPGDRPVERGDLLTMDFGALVGGYHADMTRTVAIGEVGSSLAAIHDLVRRAQQAGVEAAADGVPTAEVDRACRDVIAAAGHGAHFTHGTGHGVGLVIHETPFLGATTPGTLGDRMTVTVEPGVYVPGLGGARIEDVVLVTTTGAERLTTAPHGLIAV